MKINVAIAEDNNLLAQTIMEKLGFFSDELEFRFRASNGEELVEKLADERNIDAILMDIEMPVMDGIKATEIVSNRFPQIKIIMLTVFDDDKKIFDAIRAGANGYLLKEESADVIFDSIKIVMNGGASMSPLIAFKTLGLLRKPERIENTDNENFGLSKREIEVLEQISRGLDYKEIATNLFISPATVRKHIENIYQKLQVNNKMNAVAKAAKNKLI